MDQTDKVVILSWKWWPNKRFLTLKCDHESIRMFPEVTYYIESPQSENIKWSSSPDRVRHRLFQKINTVVTVDGVDSVVKRVVFCHAGLDIELFKEHSDEAIDGIRRYIEDYVQEALDNQEVKCVVQV